MSTRACTCTYCAPAGHNTTARGFITSGPPQKTEGVLFRWSMGWYFSRGGRSLARAVYRYVSCAPDMRMCVMWLWAESCGDVLHAG